MSNESNNNTNQNNASMDFDDSTNNTNESRLMYYGRQGYPPFYKNDLPSNIPQQTFDRSDFLYLVYFLFDFIN
jgi:hypothetical protein